MSAVKGAFRPFLSLIVILLLGFSVNTRSEVDVEISGLLLDNTLSRQGHEFAFYFSQLWREMPDTQGLNVQLQEQVVPRAGTRLVVKLNQQAVFVTYMGRRQSPVKEQAEQAILMLIQALASMRMDRSNPDMAEDGF